MNKREIIVGEKTGKNGKSKVFFKIVENLVLVGKTETYFSLIKQSFPELMESIQQHNAKIQALIEKRFLTFHNGQIRSESTGKLKKVIPFSRKHFENIKENILLLQEKPVLKLKTAIAV